MPLPAMSKTELWIGSNIEGNLGSGLIFAVGAMPNDPASAAATWRRIVSSVRGRSAIRIVMASTGQGGKQPLTEPPFLSVDSSYAEMKWVRGGTSAC
jgi:hypothetical protein